ncbi:hypothetical protein TNCV_1095341 [Trichonephila clavipes]|nr:hypothetical protein TNCV_1095341 [Trichonephila clavipes]
MPPHPQKPDQSPRNSSWQTARCMPVVSRSFEHHTGTIHLQTSMSSPGMEPRPNDTAPNVANYYIGWVTQRSSTCGQAGLRVMCRFVSNYSLYEYLTMHATSTFREERYAQKYPPSPKILRPQSPDVPDLRHLGNIFRHRRNARSFKWPLTKREKAVWYFPRVRPSEPPTFLMVYQG